MANGALSKDLKTEAIVLRRTNYGEADRIINVITPVGKVSAIARGARKERSRLAGGIEMFSLVELNIHQGKGELGIVTSAKMKKYYSNLLKDYGRMELMVMILKKVSNAAEGTSGAEFFEIVKQSMECLDTGVNEKLVEGWFWLNLKKTMGEEINLYRDNFGEKLAANKKYLWNGAEAVFVEDERGEYGADEIKMLRLMSTANLKIVKRVKVEPEMLGRIYDIIKIWVN